MEEYVVQCENALKTGKREVLEKRLITKFNEQKREREDSALAKASSQPKTADTATPTPSIVSASTSAMAVANVRGEEEGGERAKQ